MIMRSAVKTLMALAAGALITVPSAGFADAVTEWNANAGEVAKAACISPAPDPFHESRLYAMVHVAIHDALNAIDRRTTPYAYDGPTQPNASPEAAVAAAAHAVLEAELPISIPPIFPPDLNCLGNALDLADAAYAAALAALPDDQARADGIALGEAAAEAVIALRAGDGADTPFLDFAYAEGSVPGAYRFTPGTPFAAAPGWGEVTPFALKRADQFRPRPPYSVSCGKPAPIRHSGNCRRYAEDYEEVRLFGGNDPGSSRTPDQSQIAIFWLESSPLAWNRIARQVTADRGLDMWENARLFGVLNMGLADGYVASMNTKYHYAFWRPVTAIHEGDNDGNPFTAGDPTWEPFDPTPPIPDYDSAHAVQGAVAAEVMRLVFGTDQIAFDACSLSLRDPNQRCGASDEVRRQYTSFSEAAAENGLSRILVGYHFRDAVNQGLKHGRKIGRATVTGHMRPVYE